MHALGMQFVVVLKCTSLLGSIGPQGTLKDI